MSETFYDPRIPDVRQGNSRLLPKVRERNRKALIYAGGEPVLLYLPSGINNNARWDDVLQTYKVADTKYSLYLNRDLAEDGKTRLYTNNTDLVPSILIAFPSNPDTEHIKEEGLVMQNRYNSWTLWAPLIPPKGAVVKRHGIDGDEWYLVSDTLRSTYPNYNKQLIMLHQEMMLSRLSPDDFDENQFPSVRDVTLLLHGDLKSAVDPLISTGVVGVDIATETTTANSGSTLSTPVTFLNAKTELDFLAQGTTGRITLSWIKWSDGTAPQFVMDFGTNSLAIKLNATTVLRTVSLALTPSVPYVFVAEINKGIMKLWLDGTLLLSYDLRANSSFATLQPLTAGAIHISFDGGSGDRFVLSDLYVTEPI